MLISLLSTTTRRGNPSLTISLFQLLHFISGNKIFVNIFLGTMYMYIALSAQTIVNNIIPTDEIPKYLQEEINTLKIMQQIQQNLKNEEKYNELLTIVCEDKAFNVDCEIYIVSENTFTNILFSEIKCSNWNGDI